MKTIKDFTPADIGLDACTEYHTARLNEKWTAATPEEQAAAKLRAWDYIRLQPFRTDLDIFADGIPEDVQQATYEAALVEIMEPGRLLKIESKEDYITETGMGKLAVKYMAGFKIQFNKINALLAPYLTAPGITLIR
jgi:hypothetical protein